MKALITGTSGFCGRHLKHFLKNQGIEVFPFSARQGTQSFYEIKDLHDREGMCDAFRALRPDYVFHLAGTIKAEPPDLVYQVNTEYALNLLDALQMAGLQDTPVLLVGTAAEYGTVSEATLPISENHRGRPCNHYGISKLAQTLLGLAAAREGRPVVIVRPSNIIGPYMPEHLLVGSIVRQIVRIIQGRQSACLEVGNLNTARDFIDVSDLVDVYWRLIRMPEAYGQVINVCSGEPTPIVLLLEKFLAMADQEIEVSSNVSRYKAYDSPIHYLDPAKLRGLLGYVPVFDPNRSLKCILETMLTES